MANKKTGAVRPLPKFVRVTKARPRLFICVAIGIVVGALALLAGWRVASALLTGWDVGAALYLALVFHLMAAADVNHMRSRARLEDEGQIAILILTAVAALASLGAIFAVLSTTSGKSREMADIMLATITIVLSWAFTHTIFALHYAHEYYGEHSGKGSGMEFPGQEPEPDYWDFMYFSFVIGMCAQVSDVTVSARPIRRTVFGHSVMAFIFNVALVALAVNIAASAI